MVNTLTGYIASEKQQYFKVGTLTYRIPHYNKGTYVFLTLTTSLKKRSMAIHTSTSQLTLTETGGTEDTRLLYYSFEAAARRHERELEGLVDWLASYWLELYCLDLLT